MLKERQISW